MSDEPFGRQPKPVKVTLHGDREDVLYWFYQLRNRAEFKGDVAQSDTTKDFNTVGFTIYPRAVNE